MSGIFEIKNVKFGDGIPKICVPIIGRNDEEIISQAKGILEEIDRLAETYGREPGRTVSVIEFRADFYDKVIDEYCLSDILKQLREIFKDYLLLFTYRSEDEGGELRHDRAENMKSDIYDWVIKSKCVDIIDIELLSGNYRVVRTATKAHDSGIAVLMSNHDFEKTPHDTEIVQRIINMEILGADLLKVASMPKKEFDVRRVMELTEVLAKGELPRELAHELNYEKITHPVITMSMGKLGKISRISGKKTGSAMTFVAIGGESAPGQYTLEEYLKATE